MFDYAKSHTSVIKTDVCAMLDTLYQEIEMNHTLCCDAGNEVCFVYGFKGNVDSVLSQFRRYIESLRETVELTPNDRKNLIRRAELHGAVVYDDMTAHDAKVKIRAGLITMDDYMLAIEKSERTRKSWHEAKQCRCFCN